MLTKLSLAFLVSGTTQAADPQFPIFPEAFNTTELFYQPADSTESPMVKRTTTWDYPQKRGLMRMENIKMGMFTYELIRCDLPEPTSWIVQGKSESDPSTYTCHKNGIQMCEEQKPFWPLPPKDAMFNGTDLINGRTCNRFDYTMKILRPDGSHSKQLNMSFWATPTSPCRASHATQREDFISFDSKEPTASTFDIPKWLENLDCTSGDRASSSSSSSSIWSI